ncbi:phosphoribosylaminoimidazole carboxylase [Synchytrium microbalum]|uniref:Phosphoribosylaminoimidazole carboxylase n=1 Tax=Synchytrium microbalum TaxID=1806994 RepID=A0A507BRJ7_9FUNG|nr:phosphoribosylaminoimidazole carboxylase [Synchytrium microbalum]TPX30362.1 phosphoribosylaminoimidazole carboxylase [Synchytrium microbalum]
MDGSKIVVGILGGGQLGRMTAEVANRMNVTVAVLDAALSPATLIVSQAPHVTGDFRDAPSILELAKSCNILTVEIEHVDCDALDAAVAQIGVPVQPTPATIRIIQDKMLQKQHLAKHGIPIAPFVDIGLDGGVEGVKAAGVEVGYPFMLKSRTLAYDGRGNAVVKSPEDIPAAVKSLGGGASQGRALYAEKWVPFTRELAVMVARGLTGEIASYPCVETVQQDSICHLVWAPAQINGLVAQKAKEIAEQTIGTLGGAGIYGVEMFELPSGDIVVNEIAPRPHNSGHYTQDASHTSQFEQHLRCILGWPLGSTELKVPAAAMINIIGTGSGDEGLKETLLPCAAALGVPGATVHFYGKKECRKGRKMAHINLVGDSMPQVVDRVRTILRAAAPAVNADPERPIQIRPDVGIIMGSDSDLPVMKPAAMILQEFGVPFELTIVSAHRTPLRMVDYASTAAERGLRVIIAGAGGAAHLPGMVAALTPLPVIGVPVAQKVLDGQDGLLSIVQMPRGIPVATVAIGNSTNAGLLAVRILGAHAPIYLERMAAYMKKQEVEVLGKVKTMEAVGWDKYEVKHS